MDLHVPEKAHSTPASNNSDCQIYDTVAVRSDPDVHFGFRRQEQVFNFISKTQEANPLPDFDFVSHIN